ncbi:hypothetical protein NUU61_000470 [Penicillium alfredii]|uniref:Uncharacterized protein n=1 Tax=Penicillium alfredii TaxID=1506179 RepID=A0A9W9G9V4_9EURO|nr:uncharacterized protein NUU61_000470 [Penicillium alfredii]KAJ5114711.1 hypothetical protein NUU61_000470 [Penicillium alfredii]
MFGVRIKEPRILRRKYFRVISKNRARINDALRYYTLFKRKLHSGQVDGAKLVCGDKIWLYARTFGDLGYTDEGIKDAEIKPGKAGMYYSKKFVVRKDDQTVDIAKSLLAQDLELNGKGLCTPPTAAETWAKWKFIMICDDVLARPTLANRFRESKTLAVGTSIDKMQTASAEMLHEMMHCIDEEREF